MKSLMFNCQNVSELVSKEMDNGLSLFKRISMWFHLMMCRHCSRNRKQMHGLRETAQFSQKGWEDNDTLPSMPFETKERLKETLNKAARGNSHYEQ